MAEFIATIQGKFKGGEPDWTKIIYMLEEQGLNHIRIECALAPKTKIRTTKIKDGLL